MRVILCSTTDEAADLVATEILRAVESKPDLVLGLATGSTPIGVYQRLVHAHRSGEVRFALVRTVNLDEYLGLPADHPQSYRSFMQQHLFAALDVPPSHIHFPPTHGRDLRRQCREFEQRIADLGGIDIQLLGIGRNGHIGFNEPTSSLASRTRLKTLTQRTLDDNARFYAADEPQPTVAATLGIGTILEARRILLQSFGAAKANAVRSTVEGPISAFCPASALQMHADTTLYLDQHSAKLLSMCDYYRTVRETARDLDARGLL